MPVGRVKIPSHIRARPAQDLLPIICRTNRLPSKVSLLRLITELKLLIMKPERDTTQNKEAYRIATGQ